MKTKGIIPPLTTPFTHEGAVYEEGLRRLLDFQISGGVHGLFICGTYGSGPIMSLEERKQVAEITVNHVKKMLNQKPMKISVASGKGGTGKTLVATSLAMASDEEIQFLDCDVEEPNAYVLLKPHLQDTIPVMLPFPKIDIEKCTGCGKCAEFCEYNALAVVKGKAIAFSELCHSCGGCILVCPEDAISEINRQIGVVEIGEFLRFAQGQAYGMPVIDGVLNVGEAIAPPIIKAVKAQANPDLITIIDSPPGTACPMIESVKGSDYCVLG